MLGGQGSAPRTAALALCFCAGLGASLPAFAQDDVVVTAGRMGSVSRAGVAIPVTAISGATIADAGLHDLRDLTSVAPGLQVSQTGSFGQLYIRGIGSNAVFGGTDPSVAVRSDGVYLARPLSYLGELLDLERVEVLRGPQSTLYGRNAIAGTINLISRAAPETMQAEVRGELGNDGQERIGARIGGPISGLRASLSALATRRGATLENVVPGVGGMDGERAAAVRGQLAGGSGPWDVTLRADYARADDSLSGFTQALEPSGDALTDSVLGRPRTVALNLATTSDRRSWGVAADNLWTLGAVVLRSLTGWRGSSLDQASDSDGTARDLRRTLQGERQHQFSEELTASRQSGALRWIAGAYYFQERIATDARLITVGLGESRFQPVTRTRAGAVFANGSYAVTPAFSLTGGLRYSDESKRFDQQAGATRWTAEGRYRSWAPRVGIELHAGPALFYADVSKGFKSGGFNFSTAAPNQGFAPERLWAYQAGAKLRIGHGLRAEVSLFHYDYADLQVQSSIAPGVSVIDNAADARSNGAELELEARAGHAVTFGGSLAWLDARYHRYPQAPTRGGGAFDAGGQRLNFAPEWSGSAWAEAKVPMRAGLLALRGAISYQSRIFFTPANSGLEQQAGYALIDASAYFTPAGTKIRIGAWVRNMGGVDYVTGTGSYTSVIAGHPGLPRTIGASLGWSL